MKRIDNIEDRVEALLKRILTSTERRDQLLREAGSLVQDQHELQPCLAEVAEIRFGQLPVLAERAAALASTVQSCATVVDRSSRCVRRLDTLLSRVRSVQTMAESMVTMEKNIGEVPRALEAGDLQKTVELLKAYSDAHHVLAETDGPAAVGSGARNAAASTIVEEAKQKARTLLRQRIDNAVFANDKLSIMKYTKLLAELGFTSEACDVYCGWISEHTIAALEKMVKRELKKMSDPTAAAMSHLALVSQALDTVAATFENEEEFTRDTFGREGPLQLLTGLHNRSTAQCVPILRDFMERRKDVLEVLQEHEMAAQQQLQHARRGRGGPSAASSSSTPLPQHQGRSATGDGVAPASAGMSTVTADARRADQMLEEMSHLVSCCHLYVSFAQGKQCEYHSVDDGAQATTSGADSLWDSEGNALLGTVQKILATYVPLQNTYFHLAFTQALHLQSEAIRGGSSNSGGSDHAAPPAKLRPASSPLPIGSPSSFMAGLSDLYTAATTLDDDDDGYDRNGGGSTGRYRGADPARGADAAREDAVYYSNPHIVTLPDDVFFFLRIALHRAVNTKSMQISSAVVMSATDVIQTRLIPEIEAHCSERMRDTIPPGALRWTTAARKVVEYTNKLARELRQLAGSNYEHRDCLRFGELAQDMEITAKELEAQITQWLTHFANVCYDGVMPTHTERLAELSHIITEDAFYCYELNDPWVQTCVLDWSATLDYIDACLDTNSADVFLSVVAARVAKQVGSVMMKKGVNTFGALQIDKDVRALRGFFMHRAHDISLRDAFAALGLTASLLLCDTPRDALEEVHNTALSAEEKKAVLLTRVDFKREEVLALRL